MARLIQKSGYIQGGRAARYMEYVAKRDGVEVLQSTEPVTKKQMQFFTKLLKDFPAACIDLVVTSPPYDDLRDYTGAVGWNFDVFQTIARELYRVVKPGGVVVWIVGDKTDNGAKSLTSFKQALYFQEIGFSMYDVIIYEKAGSGPPHPNRYFNAFEYMFVLSKGRPKTVHILKDKPNKWAGYTTYDHISSWSDPGDLVLDPFGGSGTTAKAAQLMGREWVLIDAVEEYCAIAKKRMERIPNADSDHEHRLGKGDIAVEKQI